MQHQWSIPKACCSRARFARVCREPRACITRSHHFKHAGRLCFLRQFVQNRFWMRWNHLRDIVKRMYLLLIIHQRWLEYRNKHRFPSEYLMPKLEWFQLLGFFWL